MRSQRPECVTSEPRISKCAVQRVLSGLLRLLSAPLGRVALDGVRAHSGCTWFGVRVHLQCCCLQFQNNSWWTNLEEALDRKSSSVVSSCPALKLLPSTATRLGRALGAISVHRPDSRVSRGFSGRHMPSLRAALTLLSMAQCALSSNQWQRAARSLAGQECQQGVQQLTAC